MILPISTINRGGAVLLFKKTGVVRWLLPIVFSMLAMLPHKLCAQQVYSLSTSPATFNFTSHAYDKENIAEGVRFSFTAMPNDSSALVADTAATQKVQTKNIDLYGTDPLFQNVKGSSASGYTIIYPVSHAAGVQQYCIVKPLSAEAQTKDFTVFLARVCTLTVAHTGNGTTVPTGTSYVLTHFKQAIVAKPDPVAYFTGWSTSSGLKVTAASAKNTLLTSDTTRGTVTANFTEKPLRTISFVRDTFNVKTDGIDPVTGVLFSFVPPSADTCFVLIGKGDARPVSAFRLTYYKNDATFSKPDSVVAIGGEIHFRTDGVQTPHYFRVTPVQLADTAASFSIKADSFFVLSMVAPAFGTVAPSGTLLIRPGVSTSISVTLPSFRYALNSWKVVSGTALVNDTLSMSTTVTLNVSDATIEPRVVEKTVQEIGFDPDTLQYATQGTFASGGILCRFNPPDADSFLLEIRKPSAHGNVIYYYGTDSTFTTMLGSSSQTGINTYRFTSQAAGSAHYFRIYPASLSNQKYACIAEVYAYVNLTVQHEFDGSVATIGSYRIRQDDSTFVPGEPVLSGRYYFSSWALVNGMAVFKNPSDPASSVKVMENATVKAVCLKRPLTPVQHHWDTLSYAKMSGGSAGGILFSFTADTSDSFEIDLRACATSNHNVTVAYYGNDSTCSSIVTALPSKNAQTLKLYAETGTTFYFKVLPVNASDINDSLRIRYFRYHTLSAEMEIDGTITGISSNVVREDSSVALDTGSAGARYYLDRWVVVSGDAEITNAYSAATRVLIHSDAHLRAVYLPRGQHVIRTVWDTIALSEIAGAKRGGILFSYSAPEAESLSIQFESINGALIEVADWGDDSLLTAVVNRYPDAARHSINVKTAAGEHRYFTAAGGRPSDSTAVIRYRASLYGKVTLTSLLGTCSPEVAFVGQGVPLPITVSPVNVRYFLDRWVVRSGSATVADPLRYATEVTLHSGDAAIEAVGAPKVVHVITNSEKVYDFGSDGGRPGSGGVLYKLTSDNDGSIAIMAASHNSTVSVMLFIYGNDSLYTTPVDSFTGSEIAAQIGVKGGEYQFVRIAPVKQIHDDTGVVFRVKTSTVNTLLLTSGEGGTVAPSEAIKLPEGSKCPVVASPVSPRYLFEQWYVVSGTVAPEGGSRFTDAACEISVSGGDAHLNAAFTRRSDLRLTTADSGYRCTGLDSLSGDMLFSYTAVNADSHSLQITLPIAAFTDIWYYGTDETLDRSIDSAKGVKAKNHTFKFVAGEPSETVYFRIKSPGMAALGTFNARVDTSVMLIVRHRGTLVPHDNDTIRVLGGGIVTAKAITGSSGEYFTHWSVVSGGCLIRDTLDKTASVTVMESSIVQANYRRKTVISIGFTPDTMSFISEGAPDKSGGILLRFTAPRADSFGIYVGAAGKYDRNVDVFTYATDGSFSTPSASRAKAAKPLVSGFRTSSAGEDCFFRIAPSNSDFYQDSVVVVICSLTTLSIEAGAYGKVEPKTPLLVIERTTLPVKAIPLSPRAQFTGWSAAAGLLEIAHVDDDSAVVTVKKGPAVITASFTLRPAVIIPKTPDITTGYYVSGERSGVFLKLKNEHEGTVMLHLTHRKNSVKKTLVYYGIDSLCRNPLQSQLIQNAADTLFSINLTNDTAWHYFNLSTNLATYGDTLSIRWIPVSRVSLRADYGGTISPSEALSGFPGDTFRIVTAPVHPLFTFNRWVVDSGRVRIGNEVSLVTTFKMDLYGDAVLRAQYTVKPHDTLFLESDGHGITIPQEQVLIEKMKDTLIAAYPDKGWVFDRWEVAHGNVSLVNYGNMITRVRCNGNARLKGIFRPDTGEKPLLVINAVNLDGHPEIRLTATLRGSAGDDSMVRFILSQDEQYPDITVKKVDEERGVSVALVVDRSLTMGDNFRLDSAKEAVEAFITTMGSGDRSALISFSTTATVNQEITGDKAKLLSALYQLEATGETAIRDGVYAGVGQLVSEQNTRAVIIFSDGFENASTTDLSGVIKFARDNKVTVYSIAIGAEAIALVDATLRPLADSTGGSCYYARSASDLGELYETIKTDIMSRYVVTYTSPDTINNGETHLVRIAALFDGDTLEDTVYWTETDKAATPGDTGSSAHDTIITPGGEPAEIEFTEDTSTNNNVLGTVSPVRNDSSVMHIELVSNIPAGISIDSLENGALVISTSDSLQIDHDIVLTFTVVNDQNVPIDTLRILIEKRDTEGAHGKTDEISVRVQPGQTADSLTDKKPDVKNDSGSTSVHQVSTTRMDTIVAAGTEVRVTVPVEKTESGKIPVNFEGIPDGAEVKLNESGDSVIITWISGKEDEEVVITGHSPRTDNEEGGDSVRIMVHTRMAHADAIVADTNGNGFIDRITVILKDSGTFRSDLPDADEWITSIDIELYDQKKVRLSPVKLSAVDSTSLHIIIRETGEVLQTGCKAGRIDLTGYSMTSKQFAVMIDKVEDGAGPVIATAESFGPKVGAAERFDRIRISFSEPVTCGGLTVDPEEIFGCKNKSGAGNRAFYGLSPRSIIERDSLFMLVRMDNGYSFGKNTDSLYFIAPDPISGNEIGLPEDASGNRSSPKNRLVLVKVTIGAAVAICPNPFNPESSVEPFNGRKGALIIAQCPDAVENFDAWVTILDATGGVVVDRKKMARHTANDRWLTCLWNGTGHNGIPVSCGMYAVKIEMKNRLSGASYPSKISKVGVVRNVER